MVVVVPQGDQGPDCVGLSGCSIDPRLWFELYERVHNHGGGEVLGGEGGGGGGAGGNLEGLRQKDKCGGAV